MSGERHAPIAQPTSERTADQPTPSASGLAAKRPDRRDERIAADERDVVSRTDRGQAETPRRYERRNDE